MIAEAKENPRLLANSGRPLLVHADELPRSTYRPTGLEALGGVADWIAGVDLADPLIRHFVSDFRTLEATGAHPRWAMIASYATRASLRRKSLQPKAPVLELVA